MESNKQLENLVKKLREKIINIFLIQTKAKRFCLT